MKDNWEGFQHKLEKTHIKDNEKEKKMNVTLPGENNGNFIKIKQLHLEQYHTPLDDRPLEGTVVIFRKLKEAQVSQIYLTIYSFSVICEQ
jgi:hypothetical protein